MAENDLERLQKEHRELDEKIHEIESHLHLTPEEEVELPRLKKLKLAKKDQILLLSKGR
jgi:uncharacterized protein YdcH (DUF465 family)